MIRNYIRRSSNSLPLGGHFWPFWAIFGPFWAYFWPYARGFPKSPKSINLALFGPFLAIFGPICHFRGSFWEHFYQDFSLQSSLPPPWRVGGSQKHPSAGVPLDPPSLWGTPKSGVILGVFLEKKRDKNRPNSFQEVFSKKALFWAFLSINTPPSLRGTPKKGGQTCPNPTFSAFCRKNPQNRGFY